MAIGHRTTQSRGHDHHWVCERALFIADRCRRRGALEPCADELWAVGPRVSRGLGWRWNSHIAGRCHRLCDCRPPTSGASPSALSGVCPCSVSGSWRPSPHSSPPTAHAWRTRFPGVSSKRPSVFICSWWHCVFSSVYFEQPVAVEKILTLVHRPHYVRIC
jgi:hypothetical protein